MTRKLLKVTRSSEKVVRDSVTLDPRILISYIECLCKFKNEKRVFAELTQYPEEFHNLVEEVLPIIEKYEYRSCLGYLYDRQFREKEAFEEYSLVYAQYFKQNFYKLLNHQHCHGRFMTKIYKNMLQICERLNT